MASKSTSTLICILAIFLSQTPQVICPNPRTYKAEAYIMQDDHFYKKYLDHLHREMTVTED